MSNATTLTCRNDRIREAALGVGQSRHCLTGSPPSTSRVSIPTVDVSGAGGHCRPRKRSSVTVLRSASVPLWWTVGKRRNLPSKIKIKGCGKSRKSGTSDFSKGPRKQECHVCSVAVIGSSPVGLTSICPLTSRRRCTSISQTLRRRARIPPICPAPQSACTSSPSPYKGNASRQAHPTGRSRIARQRSGRHDGC